MTQAIGTGLGIILAKLVFVVVGFLLLGLLALGWWGWRMGGLPLLQLGMPVC